MASRLPGPDAPPARALAPKRVSPAVISGSLARTPYHTPKPQPRLTPSPAAAKGATRSAKSVWEAARAAAKGQPSPMAGPSGITRSGLYSGPGAFLKDPGSFPVSAPVPTPTPTIPSPVLPTQPVSPPPYDPYGGMPPEVASLLRPVDATADAQRAALSAYFGNQAGAAEEFAKQIGTTTTGLAQLAGIPTTAPVSGLVPGPGAALANQLGALGGKMIGAEGFNLTNAAALIPGQLRGMGLQAQQDLRSGQDQARGAIISDYVKQQGELAQFQAEQAGLDARTAAELRSREEIAAQDRAVSATNDLYDFISQLGGNLSKEQIAQLNAATDIQRTQMTQSGLLERAGISASTSLANTQARIAQQKATAKAKASGDYGKLRSAWTKRAVEAVQGKRTKVGTTTERKGQTTISTPQYEYADRQPADQVIAEMLADGIRPRDAVNVVGSAIRRIAAVWDNPEIDLYKALRTLHDERTARNMTISVLGIDPWQSSGGSQN